MSAFKGSAQYAFFASDLANVNRSLTPWTIFMGHRPMYSSSDNATGIDVANMPWGTDLEDLLMKNQVDLCLWGHVHNAEVTCPLYRGECVSTTPDETYDAPIHAVIVRLASHHVRRPLLSPHDSYNAHHSLAGQPSNTTLKQQGNAGQSLSAFPDTHPEWSWWRYANFGYSSLEVRGKEELTMRFWADSDNSMLYEFTILGKKRQ